ncbi:hypothetical protein T439DRAFT_321059 [Meredithblackwellia eburnea MCA 4105]
MFQLVSRLTFTVAGFVLPTFQSYKAIKSNNIQELETMLQYWAVMGVVMTMESTIEWVFAWFPFYYEFKTLVILWLTLPQIQGSSYIYVAHLHPFLNDHEDDIDAAIADAKGRAKTVGIEWLNSLAQRIRQLVLGTLALEEPVAQDALRQRAPQADPGTGLYSLAGNVFRTYAPAAVAAGSALLHPMNGRAPSIRAPTTSSSARQEQMRSLGVAGGERPRTTSVPTSYAGSERGKDGYNTGRTSSLGLTKAQVRSRRAELEAQLAEIDTMSDSSATPSSHSTSASSSAASPPYRPPSYHPRSVSAGPYPTSADPSGVYVPRDPVAARIERSFVGGYGFEEIKRDEVRDYPPSGVAAVGARSGPVSPGGTSRRASWWFWSQGAPVEEGGVPVEKKKDI